MMLLLLCAVAMGDPVESWDFEDGLNGFNPENSLQWEWGEFTGVESTESEGRSGWSTRLESHYRNDATDRLFFPTLNLSGLERPVLGLHHWYAIENGSMGDVGWVEANIDGLWMALEPVYGYPSYGGFNGFSINWRTDWFDLSGLPEHAELRLVFTSNLTISLPGWSIDEIGLHDGDPVPPFIESVTTLEDTHDVFGPYGIEVVAIDDLSAVETHLFWTENGGPTNSAALAPVDSNNFVGSIPGQASGTDLTWWVEATDGTNISVFPPDRKNHFRVALPAPDNLRSPDLVDTDRVAALQLELQWDAPAETFSVIRYNVQRDGETVATTEHTAAMVGLVDGPQRFEVIAVFDLGYMIDAGSPSESFDVRGAVPSADTITPADAWPGDQLRIDISGENLFLTDEATLQTGPDFTVESITVIDANHFRALITVQPEAAPGAHTFVIYTGIGAIPLTPRFTVSSEDLRPRIVAARPPTVRQGAHTTVFLELSHMSNPQSPIPTVELGEGIFVEDVRRRGTGLDVDLVVSHDAPLGEHQAHVDEGLRLLTGAKLWVQDGVTPTQSNCAHLNRNGPVGLWWLLTLVAMACRRVRSPQPIKE
jgi:hypothetical protein